MTNGEWRLTNFEFRRSPTRSQLILIADGFTRAEAARAALSAVRAACSAGVPPLDVSAGPHLEAAAGKGGSPKESLRLTERSGVNRPQERPPGPIWVHLRDHAATDDEFRRAASQMVPRLQELGAIVSINTRLTVAAEFQTNVHLGRRGPSIGEARRALPGACIGYSAHTLKEADMHPPPDYFFFSPIFATSSKPDQTGVGLELLRNFCVAAGKVPVYALGGITPARAKECLDAGAHGVAVLSGILHAESPAAATRKYIDSLAE